VRLAVVLFNLGGPRSLDAVEPFLRSLFSDREVLPLPALVRYPLGAFIAARRAPVARDIYAKIGGRSPIVEETEAQASALGEVLRREGRDARVFVAMRHSDPSGEGAARAVKAFDPEATVLLPLYPQFSATTTASSFAEWDRLAGKARLTPARGRICCYPFEEHFVAASTALIQETLTRRKPGVNYRLLLSAHGLPKRTVAAGDPYQWQTERTAAAIVDRLGMTDSDWRLCYQSRVGPLEWIGPATDAEIAQAGREGKGIVVAPIAFVSEHSETLVELDIEYAKLAREKGVRDYLRVPTVGVSVAFIAGLAALVEQALEQGGVVCAEGARICPKAFGRCAQSAI
jgi:ferrochelatase